MCSVIFLSDINWIKHSNFWIKIPVLGRLDSSHPFPDLWKVFESNTTLLTHQTPLESICLLLICAISSQNTYFCACGFNGEGTKHEVSNLFWTLITSASSQWLQSCVIYTNAIPCKWAKQNSSENDVWHFTCDLLTSVFCLHEYHMETMVYFILFSIRTAIGKHFTPLLPLKIISSLLVILSWVSLSTAKEKANKPICNPGHKFQKIAQHFF